MTTKKLNDRDIDTNLVSHTILISGLLVLVYVLTTISSYHFKDISFELNVVLNGVVLLTYMALVSKLNKHRSKYLKGIRRHNEICEGIEVIKGDSIINKNRSKRTLNYLLSSEKMVSNIHKLFVLQDTPRHWGYSEKVEALENFIFQHIEECELHGVSKVTMNELGDIIDDAYDDMYDVVDGYYGGS